MLAVSKSLDIIYLVGGGSACALRLKVGPGLPVIYKTMQSRYVSEYVPPLIRSFLCDSELSYICSSCFESQEDLYIPESVW
ncbi:hypothetical protein VNO78_14852 [Psophocarpus tetragonolobus]|uniref:Uncharacterized protein n=1 Tax=Psophocarpus tetragonolobus TaxID=3891 RepID=A0AAN9SD28_PSOTE